MKIICKVNIRYVRIAITEKLKDQNEKAKSWPKLDKAKHGFKRNSVLAFGIGKIQ